jgi:hypothetical protein
MKQSREYGQYLKRRYHNFLNSTYYKSNVLARSTDYDRTLQSTYAILSGLYPPGQSFQRFDPKFNWQPIPVHTTSKASDTVSFMNENIYKNLKKNESSICFSYSIQQAVRFIVNYKKTNI